MALFITWGIQLDPKDLCTTSSNSHQVIVYNDKLFTNWYVTKDWCMFHTNENEGKAAFTEAKIVASLPARWKLNPSYYHSFAMTDNYFVFIECPITINVFKILSVNVRRQAFDSALSWFANERVGFNHFNHFSRYDFVYWLLVISLQARFLVVDRKTDKLINTTYETTAFFTFHHGNAYEKDGHLIIDLAHYNDIKVQLRAITNRVVHNFFYI